MSYLMIIYAVIGLGSLLMVMLMDGERRARIVDRVGLWTHNTMVILQFVTFIMAVVGTYHMYGLARETGWIGPEQIASAQTIVGDEPENFQEPETFYVGPTRKGSK